MFNDYIYDIETFPNAFLIKMFSVKTGEARTYEISAWQNDVGPIINLLNRLAGRQCRMVGFNNMGYDYPVIHYLATELSGINDAATLNEKLITKSDEIINTSFFNRFAHRVPDWKQIVPQVDLYLIHHFDNNAKSTSLKMLEFNMRMKDIREMPFPPGTWVDSSQIKLLRSYLDHDVDATHQFYLKSLDKIRFRETLSVKYDRNFINHNDTKIGKDYFVMQLEENLGVTACYVKDKGKRKPKQTKRESIALKDVIYPYVEFKTPQFQAVKAWMEDQVITQTKAVFTELEPEAMQMYTLDKYINKKLKKKKIKNLNCILDGIQFDFGTGGIHASVHNKRIESDDEYIIIDLDVTSYYPSLAIVNRTFPQHLSEAFCDIYQDMKNQRVKFDKKTAENAMLKLALNGVYGDSNSKFSPFYDPQYTMTITINGQLSLCMLYEMLREIEGLELIQVNTDGLTVRVPRTRQDDVFNTKAEWELITGLDLEHAFYEFMFIRDVNNYIAKHEGSDKVKRKGAYEYEVEWHQNHNALVVKKAAEAFVVYGQSISKFIENHEDDWDFLLRTKVPRTSRLEAHWGYGLTERLQNITRYYIANDGPELVKVMPPLPKKPGVERPMAVNKGFRVGVCNKFEKLDRSKVNFNWYINEAEKLTNFIIDKEYDEDE